MRKSDVRPDRHVQGGLGARQGAQVLQEKGHLEGRYEGDANAP